MGFLWLNPVESDKNNTEVTKKKKNLGRIDIFWVWNLTYVHKSSLMLTMVLSVEDKTAQYFWNTFDDIRHRIEKKNNQTFKDKGIYKNYFLPCFWVSAPYSNLSSKFQTWWDCRVKFTSGILGTQQDLHCFQCKYAFIYMEITLT